MPKAGARAVILSPTRELALQTHKVVKELARFTDLRLAGGQGWGGWVVWGESGVSQGGGGAQRVLIPGD